MLRGLSQGCPLSSLLFSLALTPLMYRLQSNLNGILINNQPLSVVSYIDDITYVLQNYSEVQKVLEILQNFGHISEIKLNLTKSKIMSFHPTYTDPSKSLCPIVDNIKILGIYWFPTLKETIAYNGDILVRKSIALMQKYKFLFSTLSHRVYFINAYVYSPLYYFLQILPLLPRQTALLNKFVGYCLWQPHFLRIKRTHLYAPLLQGGLNLKDVSLQGFALRLNRHLHLICHYNDTFSYDFLLRILSHIEQVVPLDIQRWKYLHPYLVEVCVKLTYFSIQRLNFDEYNTQRLYRLLYQRHHHSSSELARRYPQHNWPAIFRNFQFLHTFPYLHDSWYKILYDVIPHNVKLYHLHIIDTDLCISCQQPETMEHLVTECDHNSIIWRQYLIMVARLLRISVNYLTYDQLIRFPEFHCFPNTKKRFLLWLTAHTISFLIKKPDYQMAMSYLSYLKFSLHDFSPDQLYVKFARYYTILFDY
jgi:hypothetical protein